MPDTKFIAHKRQFWASANDHQLLPERIAARASKLEMRSLWNSGINNVCVRCRISKPPLNLFATVGIKKRETVNKIVAKVIGVAAKSTSNNAPQIKYDVFVSFRGKEIYHGFLSLLIDAFCQKQINAFVDDTVERGEHISPSLLEAIEGSSISLIIFSEDYASSSTCLEELVKIIECKEKYGQTVVPIFYQVDPKDVEHQKKSYENAFAEHEKMYNMSRVQIWRHALNESTDLSGIKSSDFQNDAELLEEIVNLLLLRLNKHPINSKGLVGICKPIAHLESLLCQESKDVRIIGIWGVGGIGKTTIVEEVFNQQCSNYEGCCFLAKVREELGRHGTISLMERLFSALLAEDVKINTQNELLNYKKRIGCMKVLIVLDDVNDTNLLKILFGKVDWFGAGSRVIITTRDQQVLSTIKVDDIYEVGLLSYSEALQLFNFNAFNQSHFEMEYYELLKEVVNYVKGIPLVLKVLGSLFRGKDKKAWKIYLDKLENMPSKKVHDVLRLCYDDLNHEEQVIFLDLACFFVGLDLDLVSIITLSNDHDNDNSIAVGLVSLLDKALITISEDKVISMHDSVQEMGWEIVRQESSEDPGSCSRLWDPDDIYEVLNNNKGNEAIKSMRIDLSAVRKLKLNPTVFEKMTNLQFLDFHGEYDQDWLDIFPQGLQSLSNNLRYLNWTHYPLKSLPENFSAKNLVILDLSYSKVEKLWNGVQNLENLKIVKLCNCEFLKELPDFSKATNLEVLNCSWCVQLTSVHPSIFSLNKLEFSVTSENMMELRLTGTSINALPSSLGLQSKMETLVVGYSDIQSLPSCIKDLTRLRYLDLRRCYELQTLPELPPSIEILLVEECTSLKTVLFPSTPTERFNENRKRAEFWNCFNLDEASLIAIGLSASRNIRKFACLHIFPSKHDHDNYSDYNQSMYVYPGSNVPEWLEYKTKNDYIVIDLPAAQIPSMLGFIFCFIIGKDSEYGEILIIDVTVSDGDGEGKKENFEMHMTRPCAKIALDHVCVMYNQQFSDYLLSRAEYQKRFQIKVTTRMKSSESRYRPEVAIKGIGVSKINGSTYLNFIRIRELIYIENNWDSLMLSIFLCISVLQLKMKNLI
ncbi:disease resistance protein RML1A-like [Abrus precatorius]|uniref:ADP-ribosyl cyclase/cyclic ADP-ribose hydrolase n=1 Tax=Abrus precatorius TaxID=3816 RepID=A0A8B8K0T2_ABRPR|nr:disease resistance protein RML1A-like [Abrus precatorius]